MRMFYFRRGVASLMALLALSLVSLRALAEDAAPVPVPAVTAAEGASPAPQAPAAPPAAPEPVPAPVPAQAPASAPASAAEATPAPAPAPAPGVLISRSEMADLPAGGEAEITVYFRNLGDTALKNPVAAFSPADGILLSGGSSSFLWRTSPPAAPAAWR